MLKRTVLFGAFTLVLIAIVFARSIENPRLRSQSDGLETRVMDFAGKYPEQDCIVVSKSKHLLYYCDRGMIVRNVSYRGYSLSFPCPIAIGPGGRYETPVGEYYVCQKNPQSRYTLFLGISYPSVADAENAVTELGYKINNYDFKKILEANKLRETPPWDTPLGGTYGIHGAPTYLKNYVEKLEKRNPQSNFVTNKDNTRGCVAVEHRYLYYLFANVDEKTPILILN